MGLQEEVSELFGEMRDLTEEERIAYNKYIEGISIPTGINFWDSLNTVDIDAIKVSEDK